MNQEMQVPSSALAEADGEQSIAPEVGDEVEFTVTGKVSRVEGGTVFLTPTAINGSPADATNDEENETFDQDMEKMLTERDSMPAGGAPYA